MRETDRFHLALVLDEVISLLSRVRDSLDEIEGDEDAEPRITCNGYVRCTECPKQETCKEEHKSPFLILKGHYRDE